MNAAFQLGLRFFTLFNLSLRLDLQNTRQRHWRNETRHLNENSNSDRGVVELPEDRFVGKLIIILLKKWRMTFGLFIFCAWQKKRSRSTGKIDSLPLTPYQQLNAAA